jgi:iron complex outermembrane recepter protein
VLIFQLNNIFNKKYEPSGYTYNYYSGGMLSVNNYYYPMAGINFMTAVNIRF